MRATLGRRQKNPKKFLKNRYFLKIIEQMKSLINKLAKLIDPLFFIALDDNKISNQIAILCFESAYKTTHIPLISSYISYLIYYGLKLILICIYPYTLSLQQLLMDEQSDFDSSLQDSLDELDQQQEVEQQGASEGDSDSDNEEQGQQQQDIEKEGKGNRKKKEEDQEQKRDYYAEYLSPDEDVDSTPPFVVVVQGSSSSGKTSVIRSLVKHFTKHKVDQIAGTITLRSNKKQRITIIQCPNDIVAMIDLAKVADIVLLVIDASLSFEMETFEFLSLLKCHGFPSVMGVLTHLDYFRDNKQLKKTRKKFKKRFEYEVGGNSKLFPLSKWEKGIYPKIEVAKLARYIGTAKPPAFPWRQSHPYLLIDRWQPAEDAQYKSQDQLKVDFYGYIRGTSYRVNGKMNVVGLGDFSISNIEVINDPCPQYKKDGEEGEAQNLTKGDIQDKQQSDNDSNDGQVNDKINLTTEVGKKKKKKRTLNQSERIIYAPSSNLGTLNFDYNSGFITIPHDYVKFTRLDDQDDRNLQQGVKIIRNLQDVHNSINSQLRSKNNQIQIFQGVRIEGQQEQEGDNIQLQFRKKQAQIRQIKKQTEALELVNPHDAGVHKKTDLMTLIYEEKQSLKIKDNSKFKPEGKYSENIKNLFVTDMDNDVLNERYDEDNEQKKQQRQLDKLLQKNITKAKIGQATNFYRKGLYVKITLQGIKYEEFKRMKPTIPLILARVNLGEDSKCYLKVRFKRHRWYNNLMKSNDPIIVSSGWRRYQTLPVYATEDANERMRFLKYTPQHDFCYTVFYGSFNLQNSGCIFLQTVRNDLKKFRIAGSGVILEMNKSFQIMKKIKLIGEPFKIMKNTSFIKGMFNSSIEVASYIGAQIRTVSGIRGQIKKAVREGGQGTFRATFEDKISLSDLIFCRAWYKMFLERYYSPILTYAKQYLMKTKYQLRIQKGIQLQTKKDSQYKTIDRAPKTFFPFSVPKKLEAKLPFKTVEKVRESKKQQIRRAESLKIPKILQSDKQRQVASLIQRLNTIKNMKQQKRDEKFKQKQRLREARQRPRQQYYEKLKKQQKSQKMATQMRKKKKQGSKQNNMNDD